MAGDMGGANYIEGVLEKEPVAFCLSASKDLETAEFKRPRESDHKLTLPRQPVVTKDMVVV